MKSSNRILFVAGAAAVAAFGVTVLFVKRQQACETCKEEVSRGDLIHALQLTPEVCEPCAEFLQDNHAEALQIAIQRGDVRNVAAFPQNYELITGQPYPEALISA